jgi:hypothetical protein
LAEAFFLAALRLRFLSLNSPGIAKPWSFSVDQNMARLISRESNGDLGSSIFRLNYYLPSGYD